MAKPTISGRVEEGLHQDFEEFVEKNNISKAEGLRLLLRDGLKSNQQDIEQELRDIRDKIPDADGGKVASARELNRLNKEHKREIIRLQKQQNREQKAAMWQNVGLGSGILYLAGLTFFTPPASVVAIFGALISVVILYSVYRLSEFINLNSTSAESVDPESSQ